MRKALSTIAASLVFMAGASMANAAPVSFDASPDNPARRIVNVVFAEYLRERVGVNVETAVIDLDNDKTGEILVRFVHTGSCVDSMKKCRTVIVRHENVKGWKIVLDRMATGVDYVPHHLRVPAPLKLDDVTWQWGKRRYEPLGGSIGEPASFDAVPAESAQSYAAAFGEGAQKIASPAYGVNFSVSNEPVSDEVETLIVKMQGTTVCGEITGCPVRVLRKNGDKWATLLATSSKNGSVAISDTVRSGYRDLVVQTNLGYVVLGWNGESYGIADRLEAVEE